MSFLFYLLICVLFMSAGMIFWYAGFKCIWREVAGTIYIELYDEEPPIVFAELNPSVLRPGISRKIVVNLKYDHFKSEIENKDKIVDIA